MQYGNYLFRQKSHVDLCPREKGIGSTTDLGPSHPYENNRTEVLRLLLVFLSRQIYVPAGSLFTHPSLYSLYLVQKIPRRDVLTLLCSLMNTAISSPTSYDTSLGGMAGSVAGKIPYNHLVFKGGDPKSTLVSTCFQVLCVLLDFQSGNARDTTLASGEPVPTARTNAFRYFSMKLVGIFVHYLVQASLRFVPSIVPKTSTLLSMVL